MKRVAAISFLAVIVFLIWLLYALTATLAYADTPLIGFIEQDTVWTRAESPYVTLGRVIVRQDAVLTIEPGVTIRFDSDHELVIEGTLIARGTADDMIVFTNNDVSGDKEWGGILFGNLATGASINEEGVYLSGSIMQYCVIDSKYTYIGGRLRSGLGLRGDFASPFIDNCMFNGNIDISSGDVVVIKDSLLYYLNVENSNKLILSGCTMQKPFDLYQPLLRFSPGVSTVFCRTVFIDDNTIEGDGQSAIYIRYCDFVTIVDNTLVLSFAYFVA